MGQYGQEFGVNIDVSDGCWIQFVLVADENVAITKSPTSLSPNSAPIITYES